MAWDPEQYLRFADHRSRPGLELIAHIRHEDPAFVVDLGCGPGDLTNVLAQRWPESRLVGVDSSAKMLTRAQQNHHELKWIEASIEDWQPDRPVDVLFSNATLHWLDDHASLIPLLRSWLAPEGVLAVQMPDNWREPTHTIPADVLDAGDWPATAVHSLLRDRLSTPTEYRQWLQPASIDMWRVTYYQQLTGPDAVWNWVIGSVLRPVLATLDGDDRDRLSELCRERYADAYPEDGDGGVVLPFSRLFFVATADRPLTPLVSGPNANV